MGKASRWFRSLLSSKKSSPDSSAPPPSKEKKKGKWALPKIGDNRFRIDDPLGSPYIEGLDANKHAIAVAAATAAVAEAALAAAHAAAEVVRLTSGGGGGSGSGRNVAAYISSERGRVSAAIKIQSAFRAYLARRALRALKALVKLQALVRGHIVRKQSADMLRRMQVMARIQARASAQRSEISSTSNIKFSISSLPMRNPKHRESDVRLQQYNPISRMGSNRSSDHWMEQSRWNNYVETCLLEDDRSDKILEIDTWKSRQHSRWKYEHSKTSSVSRHSKITHETNPSISSEELSSVISPNFPTELDQPQLWTAEISPKLHSASSSRQTSNWQQPLTPIRSECSRSLAGDYLTHPNYMANTESSRAKVRSQSVPKQRLWELESSLYGRNVWESDSVSEKGYALKGNHGKAFLDSGQLNRQGSRSEDAPGGVGFNYGFRL